MPISDRLAVDQAVEEDILDRNEEKDSGFQSQFRHSCRQKAEVTGKQPPEKALDDKATPETAMERS